MIQLWFQWPTHYLCTELNIAQPPILLQLFYSSLAAQSTNCTKKLECLMIQQLSALNSSRKRMWKCKVENECINATLKRLCKRKVERYRVIIKCNWKRFWKCPIFTEKIFFTFVHILEKRFCSNLCHLTIVGFWQKMIWQKLPLSLSFSRLKMNILTRARKSFWN